jgi:hypothetical protein
MGTTNEELVQANVEKAVITTDNLASQGKLNPKQADKFIDYVFDLSGLKNNARTERFNNEQMYIDKIGVGKRVAMPAVEAQAPTGRRGVSTSRVILQPKEIIVPFEIGDTFREINLEGDGVEDHIIKMMAAQLGNDLEQLYIEGDVLGRAATEGDIVDGGDAVKQIKDTYLAMGNGWLRQADSANVVDAAGQNIGANLFSKAMNAMPAKFKRDRANMRWITSIDVEQQFRERVSARGTIAGDQALMSTQALTPFGTPLVPFPLYPLNYREVEHVVVTGTTPTSLRRSNLQLGSVVVTLATLGAAPTTPFIENTDYSIDYAAGTITRVGGTIGSGATVKVTYGASPTMLLTHYRNLIVAIGRDIRIEKDRDIYRRANQYAITLKVDMTLEETSALVKVVNIGTST